MYKNTEKILKNAKILSKILLKNSIKKIYVFKDYYHN